MKISWIGPDGREIAFIPPGYNLRTWSGFGGTARLAQLQKSPNQIGSTLIGSLLEPRNISLTVLIRAPSRQLVFDRRRALVSAFSGEGILIWEQDDGSRFAIRAIPDTECPEFPTGGQNQGDTWQAVQIDLIAPDPCWFDETGEERHLSSFSGGFSLPFSLPLRLGILGEQVEVVNHGDVAAPIRLSLVGPLLNPRIDNLSTGQTLHLQVDLAAGQQLEINTTPGNLSVELVDSLGNRSNGMGFLTVDSEFWQMVPGRNLLSYGASSAVRGAETIVSWHSRYRGV